MSNDFKFSLLVAALLIVIAAQWRALSGLRRENKVLQQRAVEAEQVRDDSNRQRRSDQADQVGSDSQRIEVLQLRAQMQLLQDELERATNRAGHLVLPTEQLQLALRGDADLPRRILPPAGPLPRDFDQYRIQMRYTGLTTVLQKKETDGSYTDVIEGPKEIGLGEKRLLIWCWPDPSRMSGSWVFIDLETGQVTEKTSTSPEDYPYNTREGQAAKWIKRDIPDPNDPQNWKTLFK
jgi:hypothetical protein